MQSNFDEHNQQVAQAFTEWMRAEQELAKKQSDFNAVELDFKLEKARLTKAAENSQASLVALMDSTGEVEMLIEGIANDFRVCWSVPRESVKADAEACPDEFVKLERKPKLREIGEYLKNQIAAGLPLPNWASLEHGEPKLTYKLLKKKASAA